MSIFLLINERWLHAERTMSVCWLEVGKQLWTMNERRAQTISKRLVNGKRYVNASLGVRLELSLQWISSAIREKWQINKLHWQCCYYESCLNNSILYRVFCIISCKQSLVSYPNTGIWSHTIYISQWNKSKIKRNLRE